MDPPPATPVICQLRRRRRRRRSDAMFIRTNLSRLTTYVNGFYKQTLLLQSYTRLCVRAHRIPRLFVRVRGVLRVGERGVRLRPHHPSRIQLFFFSFRVYDFHTTHDLRITTYDIYKHSVV